MKRKEIHTYNDRRFERVLSVELDSCSRIRCNRSARRLAVSASRRTDRIPAVAISLVAPVIDGSLATGSVLVPSAAVFRNDCDSGRGIDRLLNESLLVAKSDGGNERLVGFAVASEILSGLMPPNTGMQGLLAMRDSWALILEVLFQIAVDSNRSRSKGSGEPTSGRTCLVRRSI